LNEPGYVSGGIDRETLLKFYQDAIKAARATGLPSEKPMIVMEWKSHWKSFWGGNWDKYFPENEYGKVILDTHMYDFKKSVEEAETDEAKT